MLARKGFAIGCIVAGAAAAMVSAHLLTFAIWGAASLLVVALIDRIKPLRTTIDHHTEPPTPPEDAETASDTHLEESRELVRV